MGLLEELARRGSRNLAERAASIEKAAKPGNILDNLRKRLTTENAIEVAPDSVKQAAVALNDRLRLLQDQSLEERHPESYAEIRRICALPIRHILTREDTEEFNRRFLLADQYERGWRLWFPQIDGVMDYLELGGFLGPIGVGWGKTLLTLMIAQEAWKKGQRRTLLIIPPQVYQQLVLKDIPWARGKIPLTVPFHYLGRLTARKRALLAQSGSKGCYIMPSSLLSTTDTVDLLRQIRPKLVIVDEAHEIKNRNAARTKRLMAYVTEFKPEFVALSGTITSKSIRDYHHLMKAALGDKMPLPLAGQMATEWSQVVDADASPSNSQTGPLRPLIDWARDHFPSITFPESISGFRHAFRCRLTSAPGVVATGDTEIGTSLVMENRPIESLDRAPGWQQLKALIDKVVVLWETPNGDEIDHAIHTYKWMYELSAGFYNELVWPEPAAYAKKKGISQDVADDLLERARQHHALGQIYAKHLREFLRRHGRPGLDTPMLVGSDMAQHGAKHVGHEVYDIWREWKEADFEDMPERDSNAIRVCSFKLAPLIDWADRCKTGIIWVHHQEMGAWCYEFLQEAGVPNLAHCPAGDQHNRFIADEGNADKIIIASISAHGTGKNLQHFHHNYFLQWPRSAPRAEQVLGRTHRPGQDADELVMTLNNTLEFDQLNFAACVNDAVYIQTTTGNRQKLMFASYNPLPVIFPPEALKERGFQNRILNVEQRALMSERFAGQ